MQDSSVYFIISIVFIILFFIGLLYFESQKRTSLLAKILLVILSYIEGVLIAFYLNASSIYIFFISTTLFGILIYLSITIGVGLIEHVKQKILNEFTPYFNPELVREISKLWDYPEEKIHLSIYPGRNSDNAKIQFSRDSVDVYFGEIYIKKTNIDQQVFTVGHEIGHHQQKFQGLSFPIIIVGSIFVCTVVYVFIVSLGIFNILISYFFSFLLFIITIMAINYSLWPNEYNADIFSVSKTKKLNEAISLIATFRETQKDYGIVINLIFYTHPNPEYRIQNLKKITF